MTPSSHDPANGAAIIWVLSGLIFFAAVGFSALTAMIQS